MTERDYEAEKTRLIARLLQLSGYLPPDYEQMTLQELREAVEWYEDRQ